MTSKEEKEKCEAFLSPLKYYRKYGFCYFSELSVNELVYWKQIVYNEP